MNKMVEMVLGVTVVVTWLTFGVVLVISGEARSARSDAEVIKDLLFNTSYVHKIPTTPRQCLLDDSERYSRLAEVPEGTIAVEFREYPLPTYFMACRPLEGE